MYFVFIIGIFIYLDFFLPQFLSTCFFYMRAHTHACVCAHISAYTYTKAFPSVRTL